MWPLHVLPVSVQVLSISTASTDVTKTCMWGHEFRMQWIFVCASFYTCTFLDIVCSKVWSQYGFQEFPIRKIHCKTYKYSRIKAKKKKKASEFGFNGSAVTCTALTHDLLAVGQRCKATMSHSKPDLRSWKVPSETHRPARTRVSVHKFAQDQWRVRNTVEWLCQCVETEPLHFLKCLCVFSVA